MIETKLTQLCLQIAKEAHAGQLDKAGKPYIEHPTHLAEQMSIEETAAIALLHDVLEDGEGWTREKLLQRGVPEVVVENVEYLTRPAEGTYMDYIRSLKSKPLAKQVKLADLRHNMDLSRLPEITERDLSRKKRYEKAIRILEGEKE